KGGEGGVRGQAALHAGMKRIQGIGGRGKAVGREAESDLRLVEPEGVVDLFVAEALALLAKLLGLLLAFLELGLLREFQADDDGDALLVELVGHAPGLGAARDPELEAELHGELDRAEDFAV